LSLKVVYTVTSSGTDIYSAMTRISVASIRLACPGFHVAVACDEESALTMEQVKAPLLQEVDEVITVATPDGSAAYRNRHVKTRLRALIEGEFLSLDSDTIVRDDLSSLTQITSDVAAAPNHSSDSLEAQIWSEDRAHLETMDWKVSETYFNGGFIFYRDTAAAQAFGTEWHDRWQAGFRKTGRVNDQPALNASINALGTPMKKLPHRYNAQFTMNRDAAKNALVWHYYSTDKSMQNTAIYRLINGRAMKNQVISSRQLIKIMKSQSPWKSMWFRALISATKT